MNFLLFSGSLREGSYNKKLIAVVQSFLSKNSGDHIVVADLKKLNLPVYDADIESEGIPLGVRELGSLIQEADALVISSPEYNASIAGSLKNTIDWISRLRPVPLENKPVLLMGASPGYFGTIRALGVSKAPFETLGAYPYHQPFALPRADQAFLPSGDLGDEVTRKKLESLLQNFRLFAQKLSIS